MSPSEQDTHQPHPNTLPTVEEFRSHVDAHHGIFDPRGQITQTQDRTHAISILAGAFLNSFHGSVSAILNNTTVSRDDPLTRTTMTLDLLDKIEYGEPETAVEAAQLLWKIHSHASATLDDGTVVTATDTDLLAVAFVTGFRCTAALRVLERITAPHYDQDHADELFAAYWTERAGLMAAVGIPDNYLPPDPVDAVQWWSDQIQQHLRIDAAQHTLEAVLDSFESTASTQVTDTKTRRLAHAASGAAVRVVRTVAYYAAPPTLRAAAWPDGPPATGHALAMTIPATKHLPDWMFGGLPRECPQARRVAQLLAEEGRDASAT